MSEEKRRQFDKDLDELAGEGIACRVEGDHVICTGEILKTSNEEIRVPKTDFNAPAVRKLFEDKMGPT